jgi:hypothetical protein
MSLASIKLVIQHTSAIARPKNAMCNLPVTSSGNRNGTTVEAKKICPRFARISENVFVCPEVSRNSIASLFYQSICPIVKQALCFKFFNSSLKFLIIYFYVLYYAFYHFSTQKENRLANLLRKAVKCNCYSICVTWCCVISGQFEEGS